ncbi:hypothetical protein EZS27_006705 [termite gut metagenome]|uniref:Uncharacterized protein n=1 Tax=termite gut metagenome TaxID=433724 RepID=A0A5J4SI17_9ZZZZ
MKKDIIYEENGGGFIRAFIDDKVEKVNPVEYYQNYFVESKATFIRDLLYVKDPLLTSFLDEQFFIQKAKELMGDFFKRYEDEKIHDNYIKLLETSKKKEQISLLKGMTLTPDQLMKIIFTSYSEHKYLYSKYNIEILAPNIAGKKPPKIAHLKEDGTIHKIGETDMTDGEIKNMIESRKVIVSHFLEREAEWHCFFTTYNGLGGKENYKDGQAHFHYISSSFGISKDDFIESMRSGNYKSTSVHIDLFDYGNQSTK